MENILIEDGCVQCNQESHIGAHGIRDGEVYSEYWCGPCYNQKDKKNKPVLLVQEQEIEVEIEEPKSSLQDTIAAILQGKLIYAGPKAGFQRL